MIIFYVTVDHVEMFRQSGEITIQRLVEDQA